MNRRDSLKALACLGAAYALPRDSWAAWLGEPDPSQHPLYRWINQKSGPRPAIGWFSGEEYAYHELKVKREWQLAPEFYAFMDHPAVVNRQFVWKRNAEQIFVWASGEYLTLSGVRAASVWHSDPANKITHTGATTTFVAQSLTRLREAMVMPALQFHIGQHPVWQAELNGDAEYQLVISVKGRSGMPLYHSPWCKGSQKLTIPVAALLQKQGYTLNYAQLHVAVVVWKQSLTDKASVSLNLKARTKAIVLLPLPIIRHRGVQFELTVKVLNAQGQEVAWSAKHKVTLNGQVLKMHADGTTLLKDLPVKDHLLQVGGSTQIIRVTDGQHWHKDAAGTWTNGKEPRLPLTGTYSSIVHVADPGTKAEKFLHSEKDYLATAQDNRHYHFWESLTSAELNARFAYLAAAGLDVVHMSQGWGFWQKLDAGGKVSPFAAELYAQYYRLAARHKMYVVQALSHYPYFQKANKDGWGTPPNEEYFKQGLKDENWQSVSDTPFQRLFDAYLKDYGLLFKDEDALLLLSTSGEGDQMTGAARCAWVEERMKDYCPNTAFYAEPIHIFYKSVKDHVKGWTATTIGSRTYTMGALIRSDVDLNLYFRLNRMDARIIMAEGAFPAPELYSKFQFAPTDQRSQSWIGTEYYRLHVRDNLYQGLVMGMPIMLTWEEQFTEDERMVLRAFRQKLGRLFIPAEPRVEVLYAEAPYKDRAKTIGLVAERAAREGLADYKLVEQFSGQAAISIDPSLPISDQQWQAWQALDGLKTTGGYAYTWARNIDGTALAIYAYNVAGETLKHEVLYGRYHRVAAPAQASIELGRVYTGVIWNLNTHQSTDFSGSKMTIENGTADYLILLHP